MSLTWVLDAGTATVTIENGPIEFPLDAYQGDDFRFLIQLRHGGTPLPLTGSTGLMQVRAAEDRDSTLIVEMAFVDTNLDDGWVEFYGSHLAMDPIAAGIYYYDAQVTSDTGAVRTYARGPFTVNPEISKESP